jgi:hypothetical protein
MDSVEHAEGEDRFLARGSAGQQLAKVHSGHVSFGGAVTSLFAFSYSCPPGEYGPWMGWMLAQLARSVNRIPVDAGPSKCSKPTRHLLGKKLDIMYNSTL